MDLRLWKSESVPMDFSYVPGANGVGVELSIGSRIFNGNTDLETI